MKNTPDLIQQLKNNEVFVFGSNIAGNHAGGAAKLAHKKFGAERGFGEGLMGQSYALPTLTESMEKRTLEEIKTSVESLYQCANDNPEKIFLVTKVGCGIAGFTEQEMSPLFANPPKNVVLPPGWGYELRWKFLREGLKSDSGNFKWTLGKWKKHKKSLVICKSGFHCSMGINQAFSYVQGEILALVAVKGNCISEDDKDAWSEMRIVRAWHWTKTDNVALAIYAAEEVLPIYEKVYPQDKRPRLAIEAAKVWLANPSDAASAAARAAASAAARAAARAAWAAASAAAWAAWGAARAAERATSDAAAWAAWGAARAASDAASAAAFQEKIEAWMKNRVEELQPYEKH